MSNGNAKVFIDLSDQYNDLSNRLKLNEAHSTADEVINHILTDQFFDMLDPYYEPEQTTDDWRFESLGTAYGVISKLAQAKIVAGIESYKARTSMKDVNVSFGGTCRDGVIVIIGGS